MENKSPGDKKVKRTTKTSKKNTSETSSEKLNPAEGKKAEKETTKIRKTKTKVEEQAVIPKSAPITIAKFEPTLVKSETNTAKPTKAEPIIKAEPTVESAVKPEPIPKSEPTIESVVKPQPISELVVTKSEPLQSESIHKSERSTIKVEPDTISTQASARPTFQKKMDKTNAKKGKGKQPDKKVPNKVKEMMKKHSLSLRSAFKVYKKSWTLEEAIKDESLKDERRKQAEELCKNNPSFNLSLACYLIREGISPQEFLAKQEACRIRHINKQTDRKRKMGEDNNQKMAFDTLNRFCQEKIPLELARYEQITLEGYLREFGPYEFFLMKGDLAFEIHRLKLKYFYEKRYSEQIKKWIVVDKSILKKKMRPNYRPTNRYQFPEGVLSNGAEVMLALHEGEMIRGKILWFTPYDILLQANKAEVWVFRHAVAECALIRKP